MVEAVFGVADVVDLVRVVTVVVDAAAVHVSHITGQFPRTSSPMTISVHFPLYSERHWAGSILPLQVGVVVVTVVVVVVVAVVVVTVVAVVVVLVVVVLVLVVVVQGSGPV